MPPVDLLASHGAGAGILLPSGQKRRTTHELVAEVADGALEIRRVSDLGGHVTVAQLQVDLREALP